MSFSAVGKFMFVALTCAVCGVANAQAYLWREAESADGANFEMKMAKGPTLSGGQWVTETLSKEEVAAGKLGQGRSLKYNLNVTQEGRYNLWIRLGYESVRAPLQWRVDSGEWKEISPSDLTVNLIELGVWYEAGWMKAGALDLTTGQHTLELQANKPGPDGRFLLALDVIALVQGDWTPEDALKPGEEPNEDVDRQAAAHLFSFPDEKPNGRVTLPLNGLWQVCRHDDLDMDAATFEPVRDFPRQPRWRGIQVPSDLHDTPALNMTHRVWYRCRVNVPSHFAGRGFFLDFTGTNWIASVVVNGEFVGGRKSTRIPWQVDITRAVKPGQVNEIYVGIKDAWYAIDAKSRNKTLDETRNVPTDAFRWTYFVAPIYPSTKGDADGTECGITDPVSLVVTGQVYVEDVFVQTSVAKKSLTAEVTLRNTTTANAGVNVEAEAIFENSGKTEKRLSPVKVSVPAGGTQRVTLTTVWADAKLWFPDEDPANIYRLRTTVMLDGKPVDLHEQRFGFREVTIDGKFIRINGLRRNFWNLLDGLKGNTPEEMLAHFRKGNNRFERFSEDLRLRRLLGPRRNQLDWTDTHGIAGRLSTMIDGMFINYDLTNPLVWENFREHVQQVVTAYRNYPSIIVWSLENELVLINGRLRYGGVLDKVEAEAKRMVEVAHQCDPTRPAMLDGAGALKDNSLEINCLHYPEPANEFFPENAYTLEKWGSFGERWIWDRQRPLAMGEISFFAGKNADHAWISGDRVFLGREAAAKAYAKYVRSLIEGYRWNDVAMICPWVGMDRMTDCWNAMSPLAAFVREYNASFFGGERVTRTVKVFNDTFSAEPVKFSWAVEVGGKRVAGENRTLTIEPGFGQELTIQFAAPKVSQRTQGRLVLEVTRNGDAPYRDVKQIAFFPRVIGLRMKRPVFVLESQPTLATKLVAWGVTAKSVKELTDVTAADGIVIVAPDILKPEHIASLAAYANNGGRVICLEQENPLQDAGLPVALKVSKHQANYAFGQGLGTSMLAGLAEADFANWAGDAPTAKRVWDKPGGSARSWVECGDELNFSALLEIPCGKGVIVASQMRIGAKLDIEPAAQVLLANALRYCDTYQPPTAVVGAFTSGRTDIANLLRDIGCRTREVKSLDEGLNAQTNPLLVVHASKTNLEALLRSRAAVERYVAAGGWIMLWGLEPDGLAAYNALLGTQHLLRGFRIERVSIVPDPLTAGLGNRDVALYSTQELLHGDKWLSLDVFTACVDGADIAPFCRLPGQTDEPYKPTFDDHDPYNLVNGMTGHDFWRYILQIWHADWKPEGSPPFVFKLPVPCNIISVKIWNNAFYNTVKDMEIALDGRPATTIELPDDMAPAEAKLGGKPARQSVELVARSIRVKQEKPLVGIDNVQIIRELPDWFKGRVYPLVNVGGLVRYPRSKGGFVLNQIKLIGSDTAENVAKKKRIVSVLLQNLGAAFGQ